MKTRPRGRASSGFTLVELLVVIAIIVVLAAMSFGAANLAFGRAKKLSTSQNANALQKAIESYYSDYSKLPDFGGSGDEFLAEGESGAELLTILLGKEEVGSSMQNPRQIAYMNAAGAKNKAKGGLVYTNNGTGGRPEGFYDAYGKAFYFKLDTEYDQELEDPFKQGNVVRGKVVIVYSYGPDGKPGTEDDVKTW